MRTMLTRQSRKCVRGQAHEAHCHLRHRTIWARNEATARLSKLELSQQFGLSFELAGTGIMQKIDQDLVEGIDVVRVYPR